MAAAELEMRFATLFAKQGAVVHILELNAEAAKQTVEQITEAGGTAFSYSCDVSDQQQVIDVFSKIGNIDILVNNAGIAHVGKLQKQLTVRLLTTFST